MTPCRRAGRPRRTHLPAAGRDGGGGAAARPRGRRRPLRRPRAPRRTPRCTSWPPPACRSAQLADVLAPSLFGGHRLVVVTGVQEAAAALSDALIGYAKDPDPELTLVVVHFGGKRNEALVKAFTRGRGGASTSARSSARPATGSAFVRNEVRPVGGRITADAVAALVDAIGDDLRQLSAAASQLVSDFGGTHRRRRGRPLPPRAGRGHRLHRRRAGAARRPRGLDRDAALGARPRGRARPRSPTRSPTASAPPPGSPR